MNYGVKNAYGSLKRVIVHRPGPELDLVTSGTLEEFHFAQPVNRQKFVSDYDQMLSLFREQSVETLLLREILKDDEDAIGYIDHRPNITYTRDLAAVFSRGAVLMPLPIRSVSRIASTWVHERANASSGLTIDASE